MWKTLKIIEISSLLLVLLRPQLTFVLKSFSFNYLQLTSIAQLGTKFQIYASISIFFQKNCKNNDKIMSRTKILPHLLHIPTPFLGTVAALVGHVKKEMSNFVIIKNLSCITKK